MDPDPAFITMAAEVAHEIEATKLEDDEVPSSPPATASDDAPMRSPEPRYEEPLYTEINIPLPPLPKPKALLATGKRPKSHSISSFRAFHRRGSSADSTAARKTSAEEWPRIKKEVKSREVASAMNLAGRHRRSGTVDALAVVPAVLVLSAELFTPGVEKSKVGKWEDGMI